MKRTVTVLSLVLLAWCACVNAAITGWSRAGEIAMPEATLNNGGVGSFIAGDDLDGDGKVDIYIVNDNWNDGPSELIPRIYKLELNAGTWETVWSAVAPIPMQNTWPQLAIADLDKDGKKELLWAPVNFTDASTNPNPARILVYEQTAPNSDIFGISDGAGGYNPNASYKMTTTDMVNIRPMDWEIVDIDSDGTLEIVLADRVGATGGYGLYFAVISVNNIPDNGDGSEVWTMETSGKDLGLTSAQNKWDVAVVNNNAYFFDEVEITKLVWDGSSYYFESLAPMAGGSAVQSAMTVDLDKDGTEEIICAVYDWGTDALKGIYLLQEHADTLVSTELYNLAAYWPSGSRGPWGGACGDIDHNGKLDFVFGSRDATPDGLIMHFAYKGGDITDPANYTFAPIDSGYGASGLWNLINIVNIDDDADLEVLYGSSIPVGGLFAGTSPICILDPTVEAEGFKPLVVVPDLDSLGLRLKPGSILDNGQTVWVGAMGSSLFGNVTYAFRSTDGGQTFTQSAEITGQRIAQLGAFDANTAVIVTEVGKIMRTIDGGASWTEAHSYSGGWFDGVQVFDENVAVAYGDGMYFCRTTDKGATWTEITGITYGDAIEGIYTYGMSACHVGQTGWFSAYSNSTINKGYIFKTTDAGLTWSSVELTAELLGGSQLIYGMSFADADQGMANANGKKPVYTTDGGATWTACATNPGEGGAAWVNAVVAIPNTGTFIALCDSDLYYTEDLGTAWTKMETPAATGDEFFISAVVLDGSHAYFMTQQGTAVTFGGGTGIVDNKTKLPDRYVLLQNYPNPFNPSTNITFEMPFAGRVELRIFDLTGREVAVLMNQIVTAGAHTVRWNGLDKHGNQVAAGVYLCTLKSGDVIRAKRMSLIK